MTLALKCKRAFVFLFLFVIWEWYARSHPSWQFLCPPPSSILLKAWESLDVLAKNSFYTLQHLLGGFLLALITSVFLSVALLFYRPIQTYLHPLLIFIQSSPVFALAPFIVLWFNWGEGAVVTTTALSVFFPLTLTIYQGLLSTPLPLLELFALHQATRWQTLFKLRFPYALPHIFSGLKIAIGSAGFAAIAGEWVAAHRGLGILILESKRNYDIPLAFAGLLTLTLITFSLFYVMRNLEKSVFADFRISKTTQPFKLKSRHLLLLFLFFLPYGKVLPPSPQGVPIQVLLDWTSNPNHIVLYAGVKEGFFLKEGINLQIRKHLDSGAVLPHVLLEKVDLTLYHAFGILKTSMQGAPIQIVGRLIDSTLQGFLCREDEPIHSLQDLNGKVLGFCLNHSGNLAFLLDKLKEHGVVPSAVKNVSTDLISPMLLKKIDFLYGAFSNIEGVKLKRLGLPMKSFSSDTYGCPTGPQLLLCGKQGTTATSPSIAAAIQRALEKSILFCKQHPDKAFCHYLAMTKDTPKILGDEYQQWLDTLPLLAQSQAPLSTELMDTLYTAIAQRYPELAMRELACPLYAY